MTTDASGLFPNSPREIYANAPLLQVICQLRFPILLKIESSAPADFQERIRDRFPLSERARGDLPPGIPDEVAKIIRAQEKSSTYQFLTEDRAAIVTLEPGSLALTHNEYNRWEDFDELLRGPLDALAEIYRPSFFSRIGLRYRNAIDRKAINLSDSPWSELLNAHVLGELGLPEFEQSVENIVQRLVRFKIPNERGSVFMRHGLETLQDRDDVCYIIDNDFFTEEKTEVQDARGTLLRFHELAGRAFRWTITEKLRSALVPTQLE